MNTRVMTMSVSRTWPNFSLSTLGSLFLVLSILLTAFGIVYLKDLNRRMFIQLQNLQQSQQQYQSEWGKLLLEESAWSAQSRVQDIAQKRLGMLMPDPKNVVILEASDTILASK